MPVVAGGGLPDTHALAIRTRVHTAYGARAAKGLRRVPGGMRLATSAGAVVFTPTTTRFLKASSRERQVAAREARLADDAIVVPAGSRLERRLVQDRLSARPPAGAGRKGKRAPVTPPPDPLERVLAIIAAAGLNATVDLDKPIVESLGAHFRRVPNYGICLDARGMDVHFLPTETRVFGIQPKEQALFGKKSRGRRYVSVKAGTQLERQVVTGRLRRLVAAKSDAERTVEKALETPLGKLLQAKLPHWTVDPYNVLLLENGSISIRKNAGRLGVLRPDHASFTGETIRGNFLSGDGPWSELDAALARAAAPRVRSETARTSSAQSSATVRRSTGWRPKSAPLPQPHKAPASPKPVISRRADHVAARGDTRRRIGAVPTGVDAELAELVVAASRAIRMERNAAFSHEVQLRAQTFSVRYQPVEGSPPRLSVRFEVRMGDHAPSSGAIWLWTGDPLALVFDIPPDPDDEPAVWAIALLAFHDLTVWPDEELSSSPHRPTAARDRRSVRAVSPQRERRLPRRRGVTSHTHRGRLDIAALRAHMVAGHKRWLPDGWEASSEKLREAATLGILLEPGQTWVTAHSRGAHGRLNRQSVVWEPPALLSQLVKAAGSPG